MHLFAYGSLVDPACLDEVLGHPHPGERLAARLSDFARVTSAYPYPLIVEAPGQRVDGVLIRDLTCADLAVLDGYEEVDQGTYRRRCVEVDVFGCGPRSVRVQAEVYVGGPSLVASTRT